MCRGQRISKNSLNETPGHWICGCVCKYVSVSGIESMGVCIHRNTTSLLSWLLQACAYVYTNRTKREGKVRHKLIIWRATPKACRSSRAKDGTHATAETRATEMTTLYPSPTEQEAVPSFYSPDNHAQRVSISPHPPHLLFLLFRWYGHLNE